MSTKPGQVHFAQAQHRLDRSMLQGARDAECEVRCHGPPGINCSWSELTTDPPPISDADSQSGSGMESQHATLRTAQNLGKPDPSSDVGIHRPEWQLRLKAEFWEQESVSLTRRQLWIILEVGDCDLGDDRA